MARLRFSVSGQALTGGFEGTCRHVGVPRRVLRLVLLHLERLDTVRQLDHLDAALEALLRRVRANLGQQVVVGGGCTGQPNVLQGFLLLVR